MQHPTRNAVVGLVIATTAVQAILSLSLLTLPAVAPELAATLGVDASLIGLQVSIVYGGAMATSLFGGTLVRRYGACRVSQSALALAATGCLMAALAALPALALGSALLGLGYGLTNPAASHLLARAAAARRRNLIFSIKQTGVPIGGTLAGVMAPPVAVAFGWQWSVILVAAAATLLMLALQPARAGWDADRDPGTRLRGNPLAGLEVIWARPPLRWLALTSFFFAVVQLCLMTFLVTMLVKDAGLAIVVAGVVLAAVQVAGVAGRLLWGAIADRVGDGLLVLAVLAMAMAGCAGATALLSPDWPLAAVYALLIPFGLTAIGWNGVYLAEVARMAPPDQVSRATGASLFFTFGGVLCGPSAFTLAYSVLGSYTATFALLALVAGAGLVLVLLARRGARPKSGGLRAAAG